jgi:hypothetical protein
MLPALFGAVALGAAALLTEEERKTPKWLEKRRADWEKGRLRKKIPIPGQFSPTQSYVFKEERERRQEVMRRAQRDPAVAAAAAAYDADPRGCWSYVRYDSYGSAHLYIHETPVSKRNAFLQIAATAARRAHVELYAAHDVVIFSVPGKYDYPNAKLLYDPMGGFPGA